MMATTVRTGRILPLLCLCMLLIFCVFISFKINYGEKISSVFTTKLSDGCRWTFDHYSPSPWEQYWYNNITYLQERVCAKLNENDQIKKSTQSLKYIMDLQQQIFNGSLVSNEYDQVLSKMYYKLKCPTFLKTNSRVSQYIEPLIGLLRDPLTICTYNNLPPEVKIPAGEEIQSKRFFLLGPSAPYQNFHTSHPSIAPWLYQPGSKKILFDIGSSLFNGVDNPDVVGTTIGARWFYDYFRLNSLNFDRIVAFEVAQYAPKKYWRQIPDDIIGLVTFINSGVEKTGKFNPWNILKSIAKVNDYVIIKLDIDTSPLEMALVQQILDDRSISSLIDEMFFEMHITVHEMVRFWGSPPGQLKDSYILFTKLRQLGIRMHSWP